GLRVAPPGGTAGLCVPPPPRLARGTLWRRRGRLVQSGASLPAAAVLPERTDRPGEPPAASRGGRRLRAGDGRGAPGPGCGLVVGARGPAGRAGRHARATARSSGEGCLLNRRQARCGPLLTRTDRAARQGNAASPRSERWRAARSSEHRAGAQRRRAAAKPLRAAEGAEQRASAPSGSAATLWARPSKILRNDQPLLPGPLPEERRRLG